LPLAIGGGIAKLEAALPTFERKTESRCYYTRTHIDKPEDKHLSYQVQIDAIDKPGVLKYLIHFFSTHRLIVDNILTQTYPSPTHTSMMCIQCHIHLPQSIPSSIFREEFLSFCDEFNLELELTPFRLG